MRIGPLKLQTMQEGNGGVDSRCEYEVERDKRVAKIKKLMKPMEEVATNL